MKPLFRLNEILARYLSKIAEMYFFRILSRKNARITNLKNPDLDMMYPFRAWILWIYNPFLDSNLFSDFPQKTHPKN